MAGAGEILLSGLEEKLNPKSDSTKILEKSINMLFSNDSGKILQTTDIKNKDIQWVTSIILLKQFIVSDFCDARNQLKIEESINSLLQSRVSLDRLGRTELFDAIKGQSQLQTILDINNKDQKR